MKKTEPTTAREILVRKLGRATSIEFILDIFMEFCGDNEEWEKQLREIQPKFYSYMEVVSPDPLSLDKISACSLAFVSTHPSFKLHELVEAGAKLTDKEMEEFGIELKKKVSKTSSKLELYPYIATVGLTFIEYIEDNEPVFKEAVAKKLAQLPRIISGGMIRNRIQMEMKPVKTALTLLDSIEEQGILLDDKGNVVEDKKGHYKTESEKITAYERKHGKGTASAEGTEGVSPIPESTN